MNNKIFLAIGIFWLIIIVGFIGYKEYTIQTGDEYLVKTQPVDPRDLFRGDYVILRYDISRIDLSSVETDSKNFDLNERVYVTIENKEGYVSVDGIFRFEPSNDKKFIKARVIDNYSNSLGLEYGIESYFIPEGEGGSIEQYRGRNLDAKIIVDKNGNAIIKDLLIDGKVVSFN